MIKLLLLLLPLSVIYGRPAVYLLPDEQSRLIHDLGQKIKTASSDILLLAPSFHHSLLRKDILTAAKRGTPVKLIVNKPKNDPLFMVSYTNVTLLLYRERILEGSILVIDGHTLCTFPEALDQEILSEHRSIVRCSDDDTEISLFHHSLQSTLLHATKYLE